MGGYDARAIDQLCVYPVPNIIQPRLKCRAISSEEREGSGTLRGPWETSKQFPLARYHITQFFSYTEKGTGGKRSGNLKKTITTGTRYTVLKEERRRK